MDKRTLIYQWPKKVGLVRIKILLVTILMVNSVTQAGLTSKVEITGGGTPELRSLIGQRLTIIVNSLGDVDWLEENNFFTQDGKEIFKDLLEKTNPVNVNPLYKTKLLDLPGGGYEVRGIKVRVDMKSTKGNPFQYTVFTLNMSGTIVDVRFAMEEFHYKKLIKEGEKLKDGVYRLRLIQFIEIIRTAYNRRDISYLKKIYSDDALIIVGRVLKENPNEQDYLENSFLKKDQIRFIKVSKKKYIEKIERIFKLNDFLKINFEEVAVVKHPKIPEIYGVTLKQNWNSSTYSDQGYLFLMVDYRDISKPLIHVRSWQPEKFEDGSVVSLFDFELIE